MFDMRCAPPLALQSQVSGVGKPQRPQQPDRGVIISGIMVGTVQAQRAVDLSPGSPSHAQAPSVPANATWSAALQAPVAVSDSILTVLPAMKAWLSELHPTSRPMQPGSGR
jgi:hypothetical protein